MFTSPSKLKSWWREHIFQLHILKHVCLYQQKIAYVRPRYSWYAQPTIAIRTGIWPECPLDILSGWYRFSMSSSVRHDEMRSKKNLESFILMVLNSTEKRFKGKKSLTQTKAGGNLVLPKATKEKHRVLLVAAFCRSMCKGSIFLPPANSFLFLRPTHHFAETKLQVHFHPAGHTC